MPRALFEKTGNAIYISHLDLMRLFQRAFKRAGLPLTHTQGYNPRPSVSIALPLSVGVESYCELLDFDLDGESVSCEEIMARLNVALVDGIRVREVYPECRKIGAIAYLDCEVIMEYDGGIPHAAENSLDALFKSNQILVEKRNRNGVTQQNIIPMIRKLEILRDSDFVLRLKARVCCQNPTLNPMQMVTAIAQELPELNPSFAYCRRIEIYDAEESVFR